MQTMQHHRQCQDLRNKDVKLLPIEIMGIAIRMQGLVGLFNRSQPGIMTVPEENTDLKEAAAVNTYFKSLLLLMR